MIILILFEAAVNLIYPILAILYLLLPYDLIPDAFIGWGWIDDIVILWFLWRYLFRFYGEGQKDREEKRTRSSADAGFRDGARPYGANGGGDSKSPGEAEMRDPYQVLGIAQSASAEEIRHAYRELAGKYHPDKVMHLGDEFRLLAEARFKEIQTAYQALQKDAPPS